MNELEMDGLVVDYDGKRNVVMYHGLKEYGYGLNNDESLDVYKVQIE